MCAANSLPVQRRTISRISLAVMMTCGACDGTIGTGFARIVLTIAEAGSALRATLGSDWRTLIYVLVFMLLSMCMLPQWSGDSA